MSERMTRAAHAVLRASRMSGERSSGERAGANHVPVGRDPREPPGGWGMELAPRAGARPSVVPVDQGAADVHALSASLRWTPVDLRSAQNFDRVYRLDDLAAADANWRSHAGRGLRERGFVRFDSGLAAVFPQSTYRDVGGVLRAEVPPGTVFLIGMPTPERLASELGSSCSTRPTSPTPIQAASTATQRASLAAGGEDRSAAAGLADGLADGSGAFSIWTSKLVRDAMIHARLDEVAGNKLGPARTDRP
ncbi:MAG: hypothetical protein SFZ23_06800 [Planctomycetota bacterium]|nr:hypothetical protein [Planctomycetota bacterium]